MYKRILVTLDTSTCDRVILDHVMQLAKLCGGSIHLLHVADGWAARQFGADAVSAEVKEDTAYLDAIQSSVAGQGITVTAELLYGEPKAEILKWLEKNSCDLIAMSTHGHRFLGDLIFGSTATHIQHRTDVPVLLLRAKGK